MRGRAMCALAGAIAVGACRPTLDDRPWLVSSVQIVGVKLQPPEVTPGAELTAEAIVIGPAPHIDVSPTTWTLCPTAKPPGENRAVAQDCLAPATPDATGSPALLTVPNDACQSFGPDVPQPAPGAPPTRPHDPDATGGYYQPVTTSLAGSVAVALERLRCGLPDASLDVMRAFQAQYQPNQNPEIEGVTVTNDGAPVDPAAVPAGAHLSIEVAWSAGSLETFPLFDRATRSLVPTREVLTASWYVTGGTIDRAAAEIRDPAIVSTATTWTPPPAPADVELVVVLRDSRGGSDARRVSLVVR